MSDSRETLSPLAIKTMYDLRWEEYKRSGGTMLRLAKILHRLYAKRSFKDSQTEAKYIAKASRVMTAASLGVPDRIPIISAGTVGYAAKYAGVSIADLCNDTKKCTQAFTKYISGHSDFDWIFPIQLGGIFGALHFSGLNLIRVPGYDLPPDVSYQFIELERMKPEEYQDLIDGGLKYALKNIVPRMYTNGRPGLKDMMKFAWAGFDVLRNFIVLADIQEKEYGIPLEGVGLLLPPYDTISLLLRGITGISRDLYRYPEELKAVAEKVVHPQIKLNGFLSSAVGVNSATIGCQRAFSLSGSQFQEFFLPGLKEMVAGCIDKGIMPKIFLEGDCTHLLEYLLDVPGEGVVLFIDASDIKKAKRILGGHMCIAGNVPLTTLVAGTPNDVREYCKMLIQEVAPGGGYMMCAALGIPDEAKPENIREMIEYTLENGKY